MFVIRQTTNIKHIHKTVTIMKKGFLLFASIAILAVSCGNNAGSGKTAENTAGHENYAEVLYFHGKQRCATCQAIENETKGVIKDSFPEAVAEGKVIFRIIDISEKENKAIAEKYQVTWSSLILVDHDGGSEPFENLTGFAFAKARTSPEEFKAGLTGKINAIIE